MPCDEALRFALLVCISSPGERQRRRFSEGPNSILLKLGAFTRQTTLQLNRNDSQNHLNITTLSLSVNAMALPDAAPAEQEKLLKCLLLSIGFQPLGDDAFHALNLRMVGLGVSLAWEEHREGPP